MWDVSNTWETLIAADHYFETKVVINNVTYQQGQIIRMTADYGMFSDDNPGAGGCIAGELSLEMIDPGVQFPRMAKVEPFVRVTDGATVSEWIPQGKFFIDTRETTSNDDGLPVLSLHCYDAMMKTEADYPDTTHNWPFSDIRVIKEIASTIGVGVDSRTEPLVHYAYSVYLPVGLSMREVLSRIASMYAGNWVMNYNGELLLIPIYGIPKETKYLVSDTSEAITFGGDRILV